MTNHYDNAKKLTNEVAPKVMVDDVEDMIALAQVQATLALADEQRTANLIALWSMPEPEAAGLACAAGKDRDGVEKDIWNGVATQILARLGLA